MCISDPLSDMFSRIMNGQAAGKKDVCFPFSNIKLAVSNVLKEEGYILDYCVFNITNKSSIKIDLKYYDGLPVISKLQRISKPSRRVYKSKYTIPKVLDGLGISIITTSVGVITDKEAFREGLGGEILCVVS